VGVQTVDIVEVKSQLSNVVPSQWRGVPPFPDPQTLDKPMHDRKHLVSAEVEKLLEAAKSSRNAVRDRCLLLLMLGVGRAMDLRTGLRARRGAPFASKLWIVGFWTRDQVLVQSWPGVIVVCGWEVSKRYLIRDLRIKRLP
jgi:hypothetical protein